MQINNNVLRIEEQIQDGEQSAKQGTIYRRKFILQSAEEAESIDIKLWLEVSDPQLRPLLQWYTFSPASLITLDSEKRCEVTLSIEIPLHAKPGLYNYALILDCNEFSNQRQSRPLQFRVLPSDSEVSLEPEFSVEPVTTSADPFSLSSGQTLTLTIRVTNRSKLTDRFYVNCPDLNSDWFTRKYPEGISGSLGFPSETNGLQLNPDDRGQISLLLHPPKFSAAGRYSIILQLTSQNNPNLTLLDAVYLQLQPDFSLDCQLSPPLRVVPEEPGIFQINLHNQGNIRRRLSLQLRDRERLFRYLPEFDEVEIEPGREVQIPLKAKPRKFWRRSLRGRNVEFKFDVQLEEPVDLSARESESRPKLPEFLPQGTIIWQPRPVWLLWLLLLLVLAAIAGLLFTLWFNFFRPKVTPGVVSFTPTNPLNPQRGYQEGQGEQVRLGWQISHGEQVEKVTVIGLQRGTEAYRKTYFFPGGEIPGHLARKDPLTGQERKNNFCESVADKEPRGQSSIGLNSTPFFWLNLPFPSLKTNASSLLTCTGIITPMKQAGDYTFQIQVFTDPKQKDPIASGTTDSVAIKPIDKPQITDFTPTQLVYEEANLASTTAENSTPNQTGVVRLNWSIINAERIQEIQMISTSAGGTSQSEMKRYRLSNGRLPADLQTTCNLVPNGFNQNLVCRNVPTQINRPGEYVFKLLVTYREAQATAEISRNTEAVKITPKPLQIVSFQINSQEVKQNPKQVYLLEQPSSAIDVGLSWNVRGGEGTTVEITPAPGLVPLRGQVRYSLSAPSTETMTLTVRNPSGNQTSQSVVIQTLQAQQPPRPSTSSSPSSSGAPPSSPPKVVPGPPPIASPSPDILPAPIELPPRPN